MGGDHSAPGCVQCTSMCVLVLLGSYCFVRSVVGGDHSAPGCVQCTSMCVLVLLGSYC